MGIFSPLQFIVDGLSGEAQDLRQLGHRHPGGVVEGLQLQPLFKGHVVLLFHHAFLHFSVDRKRDVS